MEHTIVMVKKDSPSELVVVNGVTACEYLYGCLVTLTTQTPALRLIFGTYMTSAPRRGGGIPTRLSLTALCTYWSPLSATVVNQ